MHVAIIGNGIAGITAANRLRREQPSWRITVISGESDHHWSRPALMYVFMGHLRYRDTKPFEDRHWRDMRIDLVRDWVVGIDAEARELELLRAGRTGWDRLLLATGSKPNRFGWPGEDLDGVQGLYGLMDLKRLHENARGARHAVVVGGGLIGIELGEMLHSRGIGVTFLVREPSYWSNVLPPEESAMVNRAIRREGMDLRLGTELAEIEGDGRGRCRAVVTKGGERIDCQIVGLTAGVSPNLDLARTTPVETGRGVLVDASLRTSLDGVLAAGDCAEIVRPDAERNLLQQVWYTGRMQGEVAGDVLAGAERVYDPGIWFNSAKFLDLEYQTYGRVDPADASARSLWWEHASGRHGLRFVHEDGRLVGVNAMGTRYRHEVCERWIRDALSVDDVLARLGEASFDPELFQRHEREIVGTFREQMA